jgi:hypothetical protein
MTQAGVNNLGELPERILEPTFGSKKSGEYY